jgi:hypothetical protein
MFGVRDEAMLERPQEEGTGGLFRGGDWIRKIIFTGEMDKG